MPRSIFYKQQIPPVKPDCCRSCPLLGIIPKDKRKSRSKKIMVCLGTMKAITRESINILESERKGTRHPFHRPCDNKWEAWLQLPGQKIGLSITAYNECRVPYEQQQEYTIDFDE